LASGGRRLGAILVARWGEFRVTELEMIEENSRHLVGTIVDELAHQRDERRVKLYLGSVEAKEQLGKLDEKQFQLRQRMMQPKQLSTQLPWMLGTLSF
jgi:hypothetical protein